MNLPQPPAMRLITSASPTSLPRPPLGLTTWSARADAAAVLLDARNVDLSDIAAIIEQIPNATTMPAGAPLIVFGTAVGAGRAWRWLLGGRRVAVLRAPRCTALLARGYVDLGAGVDEITRADLAWGWTPAASIPC
jgi:hypothetical protein